VIIPDITVDKLSNKKNKFLTDAFALAHMSTCRCKHGAIVVKHGSAVSVGINRNINDPHYVDNLDRLSIHAEEAAIRACNGETNGAIIFVARSKKGKASLSKPCRRCQKLLKEAGIKRAYYTIDKVGYGELKL
jgi:deoxycytidylate deaminase